MKICACIDTLFTELPWNQRFQAAKDSGFEYIEFWCWTDKDLDEIKHCASNAGIKISGFNGDADFSLVDPAHKKQYLNYLQKSIDAAVYIGAESVTIHSNALGDKGIVVNHYDNLSDTVKLCSMYDMLRDCVPIAEKSGIVLNLEGLNTTTDHVGNFLKNTQMAAEIIRLLNSPMVRILYDVYHMQLNEGSVCDTLTKYIDTIGHIHVADVPGRHEPGTGELNYNHIFNHLKELGYTGKVGFELFPLTNSQEAVKAIMKLPF